MKKMKLLSVLALVLGLATLASAGTITFDLTGGPTHLPTSYTFTGSDSVSTLTAYGWRNCTPTCTANDLYLKVGSPSETGLGLWHTGDAEVNLYQAIQLDFSAYLGHTVTLTIGSVQTGESYDIFGANTQGTDSGSWGSLLTSFINPHSPPDQFTFSFVVTSNNQWITLTADPAGANGNNTLINAIEVGPRVPEPATLAMLGSGIFAIGGAIRRRFLV